MPDSDEAANETAWVPSGHDEQAEQLELTDLDLLDELTHPTRGEMVRRLKEPRSVAELADLMDVPVTRLYHHVNRLEASGLIRVTASRRVGAVTERRYQTVARYFSLAPSVFDEMDDAEFGRAVGGMYDMAKVSLQREIERGSFRRHGDDDHTLVSMIEATLVPERRIELLAKIKALIDEFGDDDDTGDEAERFSLFVAAHAITR